jgi:S-DNA-T family DNA segregation ATPase FtsK/SpoIIIE
LFIDGEDVTDYPDEFIAEQYEVFTERLKRYREARPGTPVLSGEDDRLIIILNPAMLYERLADEGKSRFFEMLEKGKSIIRMYFILLETAARMSPFSSEAWYRSNLTGDGIWLGDGFSEQYVMKTNKPTSDLYEEIGDGFGYIVSKGRHVRVKTVSRRG